MPDPLTIARRLAARGLVVIPVPPPGSPGKHGEPLDGKTPVISWKRYQTERPTSHDLVHWFTSAPMNLAVLTGALSGVVVIDVDGDDGFAWAEESLPVTPWRVQTAKGVHYYYQHPGGHLLNRVRLPGVPVDLRADAGYVMAPGSQHASGVRYRCVGDWTQPRSTLPVFDAAWLPTPFAPERVTNEVPRRGSFSSPLENSSLVELPTRRTRRARAYLAAIPPPEIGHGSDLATFVAACHLVRGFALSASDAEQLLWDWAGNRPDWDRAWIRQKVKSAVAHGKEQLGALL